MVKQLQWPLILLTVSDYTFRSSLKDLAISHVTSSMQMSLDCSMHEFC